MSRFVNIEVSGGDPISFGGTTLTTFVRTVSLRLPGLRGGLFWSKPVSVLVQDQDGQEQVVQVEDVTRQIQVALIGGSLLAVLLLKFITNRIRD